MSALLKLSQQIQDGILPLTQLEGVAIRYIREFPKAEQMKIFDLLNRFFMAKQHTGELVFDFRWLINAERGYEAIVDKKTDVLNDIMFD